jgi:hypothetical protein
MKEIPVSGGLVALVDDEDEEIVQGYKWRALLSPLSRTVYARAFVRGSVPERRVLMHRLILAAPEGIDVDHTDHNGLNNQRSNLRLATESQNLHNADKHRMRGGRPTTSTFKGVFWHKGKGRKHWYAQAGHEGKQVSLGQFLTEREAALAYNAFATNHFGEFARLNEMEAQ